MNIILIILLILIIITIVMLIRDYKREKEIEEEKYRIIKELEKLGLPAYSILFFAKEDDLWKK